MATSMALCGFFSCSNSIVFLLGCSLVVSCAQGIQQFRFLDVLNEKERRSVERDGILLADGGDVEELYFTQRLDHFDPTNLATYQQRFLVTDRYQIAEAATSFAFLCVGGEGPGFETSVLVDSEHCTGDMLELAGRLFKEGISIHLYALEHRYYGKSYPDFGDGESPVTIQNLKYLSSRQALEDLAHFVQSKSQEIGEDIKWVSFGGSYPGYMAGNARLKHPHLIYAAVSNSAPIELKVDFPEYKQKVGWDLKYSKIGGSNLCFDIVKQGHEQAVSLLQENPTELATKFNICNPETALLDKNNQGMLLGDGLVDVPAQINDPACSWDLCDMQQLCGYMTGTLKSTNMTELDILADVAVNKQRNSDECMTVDWKETMEELAKPVADNYGYRSWLWQTCIEVGFYQTCEETCPFASFYHLVDMDLELCEAAYNVTNVYENVQASIDYYGGLDIRDGSRLLSVNGDVDPWSMLGLQESPKYSLPVEMVKGASHHFWTHAVKDTDAPEIVQVREYIYSVVMSWLDVDGLDKPELRGGTQSLSLN
jgi:serine protease 16